MNRAQRAGNLVRMNFGVEPGVRDWRFNLVNPGKSSHPGKEGSVNGQQSGERSFSRGWWSSREMFVGSAFAREWKESFNSPGKSSHPGKEGNVNGQQSGERSFSRGWWSSRWSPALAV